MTTLSTQVLARAAAAAVLRKQPACGGLAQKWAEQERRWVRARSPKRAREAALPLLWVCADCPAAFECREWAVVDEYTGIAAGRVWVNGEAKALHHVVSPAAAGDEVVKEQDPDRAA